MNKQQVEHLVNEFPLLKNLINLKPLSWFNPNITDYATALPYVGLTDKDVQDASERYKGLRLSFVALSLILVRRMAS